MNFKKSKTNIQNVNALFICLHRFQHHFRDQKQIFCLLALQSRETRKQLTQWSSSWCRLYFFYLYGKLQVRTGIASVKFIVPTGESSIEARQFWRPFFSWTILGWHNGIFPALISFAKSSLMLKDWGAYL